ncbi:MAG: hypothetical protein H7A50_00535 [Akkermansiaceae bacterium]|nr:hypothetical protein [Akkermansiaceae bacterium]
MLGLLLLSSASGVAEEDADGIAARNAFLRENREKFPLVELRKGEAPFAAVHSIHPNKRGIEHEGSLYSAFRFRTPDWLDSHVIWMFALRGGSGMRNEGFFDLSILPVEEDRLFSVRRTNFTKERFPKFAEKFPGFGSFFIQAFDRPVPKPGTEHIVWFSFAHKEIEEIRFSLTVWSDRGMREIGMLPTNYPALGPDVAFRTIEGTGKPKEPAASMKEAVAIQRKSGTGDALAHLEKELGSFIAAGGKFRNFYLALWKEAQVGTGRAELEWAAAANGWLQDKCIELEAYLAAEELCANTASTMVTVNRYASARRALKPFLFAMERRSMSADPFDLDDLGPAFESLPDVRRRRVPLVAKRGISVVDDHGWVFVTKDMPRLFAGSMVTLANLEFLGGDWKRSIERKLWAADWSDQMHGKVQEAGARWYSSMSGVAGDLETLGLYELADECNRTIIEAKRSDPYQNRSKLSARHRRIALRLMQGPAEESMLKELATIHSRMKKNPFVIRATWESVEVTRAKCLFFLGKENEAEALLTGLVKSGNRAARFERIRQRLLGGRFDGLDGEFTTVLTKIREWGRKIDEAELYSLYADFLERTGRADESLAMRREAIRLERCFDLFVALPKDVARLSVLLKRCADEQGAAGAAAEALELAGNQRRIPDRVLGEVKGILNAPSVSPAAEAETRSVQVELQPVRAIAIPVKGMPLRGRAILLNPGTRAVEGILSIRGLSADIRWDGVTASVRIGKPGAGKVAIRIDPGCYARVDLSSDVPPPVGEFELAWTGPANGRQASRWIISAPDDGIASAVVDAGEYTSNPFYGIPIHHHYQDAGGGESATAFRVRSSVPARIEAYGAEDTPLFVDANGDGELTGSGDSLFLDVDADALADIPVVEGECVLHFEVFPIGDLPSEGVNIELETYTGGRWSVIAEDRIVR